MVSIGSPGHHDHPARAGFRQCWRWKCRSLGGEQIAADLRALSRRMSAENPLWGAARIPGSLPNAQDDALLLLPNHQVGPLGEHRFNVLQIGVDGR
jgi:hypothetical protein